MKTIYFLIAALLLNVSIVSAQDSASNTELLANEELPVVGVRYYYYPNLDAYFDLQNSVYIYQSKEGEWVKSAQMSSGYRGYSIYNNTRYEVTDYNGDKPFTKLEQHQKLFPKKFSSKRQPPKAKENSTLAYN
jgi:hypothetical protein